MTAYDRLLAATCNDYADETKAQVTREQHAGRILAVVDQANALQVNKALLTLARTRANGNGAVA